MKILWGLLLAAALCGAQGSQQAGPKTNPLAGDPKAVEEGRILFRGSCGLCHGIKAEGGRGPDLTLGTYNAGDTDADLFNVISNGAAGTEMPEFGSRFEEETIWRLVAYIRSVAKRERAAPVGNS